MHLTPISRIYLMIEFLRSGLWHWNSDSSCWLYALAAKNNHFFRDNKTHITAVGFALPATDAIEVDLIGTWQQSNYGLQLAVERYEEQLPKDTTSIVAYLSSGCIKGIGPNIAKAIVARFGTDTLDVMENDPDQLLTVKGDGKSG